MTCARCKTLCPECDIALNKLVLRWAGDARWKEKIARYALRVRARLHGA